MTLQNLPSPPREGLTTSDGFPETLQSKDFSAESVLHIFSVYMCMCVCHQCSGFLGDQKTLYSGTLNYLTLVLGTGKQ